MFEYIPGSEENAFFFFLLLACSTSIKIALSSSSSSTMERGRVSSLMSVCQEEETQSRVELRVVTLQWKFGFWCEKGSIWLEFPRLNFSHVSLLLIIDDLVENPIRDKWRDDDVLLSREVKCYHAFLKALAKASVKKNQRNQKWNKGLLKRVLFYEPMSFSVSQETMFEEAGRRELNPTHNLCLLFFLWPRALKSMQLCLRRNTF